VYEGNYVALLIPDNYSSTSREASGIFGGVVGLDKIYQYYKRVTGRDPNIAKQFNNKPTIVMGVNTCGYGCGYIGAGGIEFLSTSWRSMSSNFKNGIYDTSIPYEFGRNFCYTYDKLQYQTNDPVIDGFAVYNRHAAFNKTKLSAANFGIYSYETFFTTTKNLLTTYSSGLYTWNNTLSLGQGVSNALGLGATDLFASFCIDLSSRYGCNFVDNVWRIAQTRPDTNTTQGAVDNFYIASCSACCTNLYQLFTDVYKWPISNTAKTVVDNLNLSVYGSTPTPTPTPTATPTPVPISNVLFDTSTFSAVPEPFFSPLLSAANRWDSYIKINPSVVNNIRSSINPSYSGISLNLYNTISSSNSYIASCGVNQFIDLQSGDTGIQFCTYDFNLNVNLYYQNIYTSTDWANIMTHELGHALGIGIYWDPFFQSYGAIPPSNNFLSAAAYPSISASYGTILSSGRPRVALENEGGDGTSSAHWENSFRSITATGSLGFNYPGLQNDLMVGFYSPSTNFVISDLSIKALVDFGYVEKNPGSNEGIPTLINN
jgi:hypothetical protein